MKKWDDSNIRALTFDVFGTAVGLARRHHPRSTSPTSDLKPERDFDIVSEDFLDLAAQLGC